MSDVELVIGFLAAAGVPLVVLILVVIWPERIPKDRTVEEIRRRVEGEDAQLPRSRKQPEF